MSCFDLLADCCNRTEKDLHKESWDTLLSLLVSQARDDKDLTDLRKGFIERVATTESQHKTLTCSQANAMQRAGLASTSGVMDESSAWPAGSARLRLHFTLLSPLLTQEQDSFSLFDNALRKDRLFRRPYLSAAAVKALTADAYQRAFPPATPWADLGPDDPSRTRAYRAEDCGARRLFGLSDDGDAAEGHPISKHGVGRVRFSPIWFDRVQFLVMNPQDPKKSAGTVPIQFEAVAPDQEGLMELIYLNPDGFAESDERTVRGDLARMLWALGQWWSALGIGAKRLGGYGAIEPVAAQLDAIAWPSLPSNQPFTVHHQGAGSWVKLARWLDGAE